MARILVMLLCLLVGLGVAAVADDRTAAPVGEWRLLGQNEPLRIQFLENGDYRAITRHRILFGKWSLVDQSHIATWSHDLRPKRVNRFRVDGDRLYITDRNGVVHEHLRVRR